MERAQLIGDLAGAIWRVVVDDDDVNGRRE
jgi:hypothetical protein